MTDLSDVPDKDLLIELVNRQVIKTLTVSHSVDRLQYARAKTGTDFIDKSVAKQLNIQIAHALTELEIPQQEVTIDGTRKTFAIHLSFVDTTVRPPVQ